MRAPLSWLRDFTPAEGTPEEIARVLSFLGLVVEGTEYVGTPLDGIVAAQVPPDRPVIMSARRRSAATSKRSIASASTEQTMKPGETRKMAVVFHVDPKLAEDSEEGNLDLITLSYTFDPIRGPDQAAAEGATLAKSGRI